MQHKIVTNPQTGMAETVDAPDPIPLDQLRKETREMIEGNVQFHVDPNTVEKEKQ